jgi:hypothetical protein
MIVPFLDGSAINDLGNDVNKRLNNLGSKCIVLDLCYGADLTRIIYFTIRGVKMIPRGGSSPILLHLGKDLNDLGNGINKHLNNLGKDLNDLGDSIDGHRFNTNVSFRDTQQNFAKLGKRVEEMEAVLSKL